MYNDKEWVMSPFFYFFILYLFLYYYLSLRKLDIPNFSCDLFHQGQGQDMKIPEEWGHIIIMKPIHLIISYINKK